eukprot:10171346-Alexandrium_andersonii.AAC.1
MLACAGRCMDASTQRRREISSSAETHPQTGPPVMPARCSGQLPGTLLHPPPGGTGRHLKA